MRKKFFESELIGKTFGGLAVDLLREGFYLDHLHIVEEVKSREVISHFKVFYALGGELLEIPPAGAAALEEFLNSGGKIDFDPEWWNEPPRDLCGDSLEGCLSVSADEWHFQGAVNEEVHGHYSDEEKPLRLALVRAFRDEFARQKRVVVEEKYLTELFVGYNAQVSFSGNTWTVHSAAWGYYSPPRRIVQGAARHLKSDKAFSSLTNSQREKAVLGALFRAYVAYRKSRGKSYPEEPEVYEAQLAAHPVSEFIK